MSPGAPDPRSVARPAQPGADLAAAVPAAEAGDGVAPPAADRPAPEITDTPQPRIRRPVDLLLTVGYGIALLAVLGTAAVGTLTTAGLAADLSALTHRLPTVILNLVLIASGVVLLGYPVALAGALVYRRRSRLLLEALGTAVAGMVAAALADLVLRTYGPVSVHQGLTLVTGAGTRTSAFNAYLVGLVAFVTVTGLGDREPWRSALLTPLALGGLASIVGAQVALLSYAGSLLLGRTAGLAVRYTLGTPSIRPPAEQIAAALAGVGLPLAALQRRGGRPDDPRHYRAVSAGGQRLEITVLDHDLQAAGAAYRLWRSIRLSGDLVKRFSLSVTAAVERRTLMLLVTADAGVLCPELLAVVPVGPDAVAMVTDDLAGRPLSELAGEINDPQLRGVWRAVQRLHQRRVTHRLLTADRILLDAAGAPVLVDLGEGDIAATDIQIRLDLVQLLVTLALLVGPDRAVDTGRAVVGDEALVRVAPLIQSIVLTRPTRRALRRDRSVLSDLRGALESELPASAEAAPEKVERFRPRTVVTLAAGIFAAYIIIGQLSTVNLAQVFSQSDWRWAALAVGWSALTYLGAGMALRGYVRDAISFLHTILAQVAASFVSVVTPPAVGGVALNVRYLQQAGQPPAVAAATVGVSQVVAVGVHVLLLLLFAVLAGSSNATLQVPGWAFIALAGLGIAILVGLTVPAVRRLAVHRLGPMVSEIVPRLLDVAQRPAKLAEGIGGAVITSLAYVMCLDASVRAFGSSVSLAAVAVVYLTAYAVGSAAPTPGGLGAVEAALSAGLVAAGVGGSVAVSAVLLFRLVTFWLPVPVGWAAFGWLQRRHLL